MDARLKNNSTDLRQLGEHSSGSIDAATVDLSQCEAMLTKTNVRDRIVKVLLVDDLKDNLLALEGLLRRHDVEIFKARSGTEALEFLMIHEFALALVDVRMPGMSGFELAELMRGANRTKDIPIIFVTATTKEQSQAFRGYESGGVDFLLKPLDSHTVKSKVNIFIELYRQKKELKSQLDTITGLVMALNHAKTEAERANASKTQFLANMSHEIRTPLSAMLGYLELLAAPDQTAATARHCTDGIQRNIEHLIELVDEILDISKIEAGKLEVDRVRFPLLPELSEIFTLLQDRATARSLAFDVVFDGVMPASILACPMRLRQILLNVVGNALKFTETGGVRINIALAAGKAPSATALLTFVVKDTGCGLSPEQQGRLFRPFSQADSSVTRRYGGTGLGLLLSHRLAEALGGSVALTESSPGTGSTFTISLDPGPLEGVSLLTGVTSADLRARPGAPNELFTKSRRLAGLQVLLVDDGPDNQLLMKHFLEASGATVASAVNGVEALAMTLDHNYDVVLMDMQMPLLDGYEAARQLRARGYASPVIALTANALRTEREACLAAGCVEHISKPVKANVLVGIVAKFAGMNAASRLHSAGAAPLQELVVSTPSRTRTAEPGDLG